MHHETFRVGDIECRWFVHSRGRGTPAWMFPDVPDEPLARRMRPHLDGSGGFEYVSSSLLVRVGDQIALLDTSLPAAPGEERSPIDRALDAAGIAPADVGTVVVSHGHLDHVGGLVRAGRPVFGRARHLIARAELEHWTSDARAGEPTASILRTVAAAGLVEPIDGEREVLGGVRLLPTPGHTPGHLAVAVASRGETALYVGDVLAHAVNAAEPGWNHFSDLLPGPAARSRRALVERAARDGAVVIASHLTTRGHVVPTAAGGFDWLPELPGRSPAVGHRLR